MTERIEYSINIDQTNRTASIVATDSQSKKSTTITIFANSGKGVSYDEIFDRGDKIEITCKDGTGQSCSNGPMVDSGVVANLLNTIFNKGMDKAATITSVEGNGIMMNPGEYKQNGVSSTVADFGTLSDLANATARNNTNYNTNYNNYNYNYDNNYGQPTVINNGPYYVPQTGHYNQANQQLQYQYAQIQQQKTMLMNMLGMTQMAQTNLNGMFNNPFMPMTSAMCALNGFPMVGPRMQQDQQWQIEGFIMATGMHPAQALEILQQREAALRAQLAETESASATSTGNNAGEYVVDSKGEWHQGVDITVGPAPAPQAQAPQAQDKTQTGAAEDTHGTAATDATVTTTPAATDTHQQAYTKLNLADDQQKAIDTLLKKGDDATKKEINKLLEEALKENADIDKIKQELSKIIYKNSNLIVDSDKQRRLGKELASAKNGKEIKLEVEIIELIPVILSARGQCELLPWWKLSPYNGYNDAKQVLITLEPIIIGLRTICRDIGAEDLEKLCEETLNTLYNQTQGEWTNKEKENVGLAINKCWFALLARLGIKTPSTTQASSQNQQGQAQQTNKQTNQQRPVRPVQPIIGF